MAKLLINEKCNGCGGCEAYEYVEELENGTFAVKQNAVVDESNIESIKTMMTECPCQAIELQGSIEKKLSKKEFIASAIERLKSLEGIPHIQTDDIKFVKEHYYVSSIKSPYGEVEYDYKSYSAAKSAAREVFRDIMWNHTSSLMQEVIVNYKCRVLSKYYDLNDEDNIFVKKNRETCDILQSIYTNFDHYGVNKKDQAALCTFDVVLEEHEIGWLANNNEYCFVSHALGDSMAKYGDKKYNFEDNYGYKVDVDGLDVYESGVFGRERLVKRYAYRGLYDCCNKLGNDIVNAVSWSGLERTAKEHINQMIDHYNEMFSKEIQGKIDYLKSI